MAFKCSATARSRMAVSSAFCWPASRPGREGQSRFWKVATQRPRNSRSGAGGVSARPARGGGAADGGRGVGAREDELAQPAQSRSVNRRTWRILVVINGCKQTNTGDGPAWKEKVGRERNFAL